MPPTSSKTVNINGASRITDWFGSWPTFKDARLLELHLSSLEDGWLKLRAAEPRRGDTGSGAVRTAVITFYFSGIRKVQLKDLAFDSTICELQVESASDGYQLSWKGAEEDPQTGSISMSQLSVGLNTQIQPST